MSINSSEETKLTFQIQGSMEEMKINQLERKCHTPVKLAFDCHVPLTAEENLNCSPLVFLHGITSCKETWENVSKLLAYATNRKAYFFDLRNHGDSEWTDDFTVDDLVLDLHHFLEMHNINSVILVGHSLGGTLSINYALRNPGKVEMVIIEEMFVKKPPVHLYKMPLAYITLAPVAVETIPPDVDEETATKSIMKFIFNHLSQNFMVSIPKGSKIDKSTMALKRTEDGRYALKANMAAIEKSLKQYIEDPFENPQLCYDGPACFVYGELSEFEVGTDKENILRCFPRAEFNEVKNASHSVHSDDPEQFVNTIADFIAKHSVNREKL